MKNYYVDQMSKIRQCLFDVSAKKAANGISASKIEYLGQWSEL
ncbi:MAG: hypothetical protein RR712_04920 [Terrisporobacter sp.]